MRRGLAFASVLLVVAGLEMATEALSLVVARLRTGFGALLSGADFHVSSFRFGTGVVALALGVSLWVLLAWSAARRQEVASVGTACPQCGNRTRRVKRKEWQRILAALMGEQLSRRRCETCGWSGLSLTH